jgi:hypothetical protein
MTMDNETIEKYLTIFLVIVLIVVIYKRMKDSNENYENSYLPNYKVNVDCSGKVGKMVRGNNDIEYTSESRSVSGSISTDDSSSASTESTESTESSESSIDAEEAQIPKKRSSRDKHRDKYRMSGILGDKNKECILDGWNDDIFKFATNQDCDCNRKGGCTVCDMKHSNEHEVVEKICKRRNKGSCIVDKMENSNFDYIKGLMLGSNVY